jgi:cardiolipin synthase
LFRNLPNVLTSLRLILVPFVAERLYRRSYGQALLLVLIAGITDGVDGWLARRFQWTSRAGAYLDPVADKALLITLYILLGVVHVIPVWLAVLVPGRDVFILTMVAAGFLFTPLREFPPSLAGKLSTIVQIGAAVGLIANAAMGQRAPAAVVEFVILAVAAVTIWSGLDYARRGLAALRRLHIDLSKSGR